MEMLLELRDDRPLEPREAVVPFPPRLGETGLLALLSFLVGVLPGLEGDVIHVLCTYVGSAAVADLSVDGDDLAVVDVEIVDVDRLANLRRSAAETRVDVKPVEVVVDVRIEDLDAGCAHALAERLHVRRVPIDRRIVAHHLLLARGERVAHRGLLDVHQHARLDAGLHALDDGVGDLLADRIAEPQEHRDVDALPCGADVREERGEDLVPIDEQLTAIRLHHHAV